MAASETKEVTASILVVEDDPKIADLLEENIKSLGMQVDVANDGEFGLNKAMENDYSLIILDLGLPRLDGLQICRKIRETNQIVPVLMLTARDSEVDKVLGLEVGATDYLVKPFSIRELLARVQAMLRLVSAVRESGNQTAVSTDTIIQGDLSLDPLKKKVFIADKEVSLTSKEFDVLHLLLSHPGRPFTRSDLLRMVWGYDCEQYEGTVVSTIYRLRQKIEQDLNAPRYIKTRRGMGYVFLTQDTQQLD